MIPAVVISKKRDREQLSNDEIEFMIQGYARGSIPDYQMSALAMAIFLNGMSEQEISNLTDAMIASGSRLAKVDDTPRVDKHSTSSAAGLLRTACTYDKRPRAGNYWRNAR